MSVAPYILFCKAQRAKVKTEHPGLAFGELARELGNMWKNLSDEERYIYIRQAEEMNDDEGLSPRKNSTWGKIAESERRHVWVDTNAPEQENLYTSNNTVQKSNIKSEPKNSKFFEAREAPAKIESELPKYQIPGTTEKKDAQIIDSNPKISPPPKLSAQNQENQNIPKEDKNTATPVKNDKIIDNIEELYQYFDSIPIKKIENLNIRTDNAIYLVKLRNMAKELSKHFSELSNELDSTLSDFVDKLVEDNK